MGLCKTPYNASVMKTLKVVTKLMTMYRVPPVNFHALPWLRA